MMTQLDSTTLAYIAGLLDGEGSIVIGMTKVTSPRPRPLVWPSHWLQVGIVNTNKDLIDWLHRTIGGHISDNSHAPSRKRQRPCWAWRIISNQAQEFLEAILPYMRVKRRQAELAIEFQKKRSGRRHILTTEIVAERAWYKEAIAALSLGHRTLPPLSTPTI